MRINTALRFAVVLTAGAVLFASASVWAQRWPAKPVRIIVPLGPGGGTDIQARVLTTFFHPVNDLAQIKREIVKYADVIRKDNINLQ
jgi:hypothetical protein